MKYKIIKEKIAQAIEILKEKNIDLWLTFVRESSNIKDPAMDLIVGTSCTWHSAFIITKNGDTIAILGSLDVANLESFKLYNQVIGYVKSIKDNLLQTLNKYKPEKIAINYSRNSYMADGLTYGMYLELLDMLKTTDFPSKFISSEEIISALRGRKTQTEISLMQEAIKRTLNIFNKTTEFIKPGKTEKEIADFIKSLVKQENLDLAWDEQHCPAVFTGPNTAGAHAGPTERKVEKGHLINIDFGVSYEGYCSDLQRTWYVLKDGEDYPPEEVLKGFNTIKEAIKLSAKELKPGKLGYEIDQIARQYIVNNGYAEYPHALGHQIGKAAHDGGGLLAPKWDRYGNLPFIPIEKNQVYTIEPRLNVENYGIATIEEEVLVADNGCKFLSEPQEELILIKE